MEKHMTVAELLRCAAQHHLWNGSERDYKGDKPTMSCIAVDIAAADTHMSKVGHAPHAKARKHLCRLGVNCDSSHEFDEFPFGPTRQGARYAWLMFAADIAEEWGV